MGRDWYRGSGAKTSSTSSKTPSSSFSPSGCFNAVFHLFDFHFPLTHQTTTATTRTSTSCSCFKLELDTTTATTRTSTSCSCFKPELDTTTATTRTSTSCSCFKPELDSFISPNTNVAKGAEAPRNSLESEDEVSTSASASASVSLTSTSKEDENLNIPLGIQIKTSRVGATNNETCSPGTKTPTLVARLMGLDLLPEPLSTPNLKPLRTKITSHRKSLDSDMRGRTGTRSLPETPRISSARRSDSDVDSYRHRLSLQINKENMSPSQELMISRLSALKKKEVKHEDSENNRSPGHYARMIVKQVKESVGRKLGTDITNTVRNREETKCNQHSSKLSEDVSTASPSPKLRFLDSNKSKPVIDNSRTQAAQPIRVLAKPNLQLVEEEQDDEHHKQQKISKSATASKCKKMSCEKFGSSRLKRPQRTSDIIRNKQEEPFVRPSTDKKCKKTPFSNHLLNISVPTLLPLKKDHSLPHIKIPQKKVLDAQKPNHSSQLSSCSSLIYYNKKEGTNIHFVRDNKIGDRYNNAATTTTTAVTGDAEAEYEYIARILRRVGLNKSTPLSLISWFSPSRPLDPSIFYYLEHFTTCSTQLRHRCNRKLMFHLVDEILIEILKPMKHWVVFVRAGLDFSQVNGSQLIEMLCSKIRRFPRADCRVLEDIDGLIGQDLQIKDQIVKAYEEEGDGIVAEIEKDIIEALIHETASDFGVPV